MDLQKFIKAQSPSQLPRIRPQSDFRSWCYDRATLKSGWWAKTFTAIYYVHIILLMYVPLSPLMVIALGSDMLIVQDRGLPKQCL